MTASAFDTAGVLPSLTLFRLRPNCKYRSAASGAIRCAAKMLPAFSRHHLRYCVATGGRHCAVQDNSIRQSPGFGVSSRLSARALWLLQAPPPVGRSRIGRRRQVARMPDSLHSVARSAMSCTVQAIRARSGRQTRSSQPRASHRCHPLFSCRREASASFPRF